MEGKPGDRGRKLKGDERGAIMMEALIVYVVTIFLLFFMLVLFCVFYHIWNMQTIANEAAMRVAQTYKFVDADMNSGYVAVDQLTGLERYRYLTKIALKLENGAENKLKTHIPDRLDKVSFVSKITEPEIQCRVEKDGLASRHVVVTVSESFQVPFGGALSYFGYDDTIRYECTAYADCLDIIDYVNMVDFTDQQTSLSSFNSSTVKMINSVLKLFSHISGLISGNEG